jgi:hypothetical protein
MSQCNVVEDAQGSRSSEFLRLYDEFQEQGPARVPPPAKELSRDRFMTTFKRLYSRLPGNFRGSPPDQGVEIVKTQLLLAALKDLVSGLKAKP